MPRDHEEVSWRVLQVIALLATLFLAVVLILKNL